MLEWLAANAATIIVGAVLIVLVAMAIRQIIKAKKKGGCAGCNGCSGCGGSCMRQFEAGGKAKRQK